MVIMFYLTLRDDSLFMGGEMGDQAFLNYLIRSLYNKAKEIADADDEKSKTSDASLVDKYNSSKRSVSLVQKHKESKKEKKKRSRSNERKKKGKGTINHPWKPCDREKDLTAGRQNVNLDPEKMAQGLSSRFSSGAVQRNFKDDHAFSENLMAAGRRGVGTSLPLARGPLLLYDDG
uniref:DUF3752 domain-containing protein n=1 Tax=Oryza rufipogon TaxID=4529 RepID=A0A0E0MXC9_ORYRU